MEIDKSNNKKWSYYIKPSQINFEIIQKYDLCFENKNNRWYIEDNTQFLNKQLENSLLQKIIQLTKKKIDEPTLQKRDGLLKFFFWKRYTWGKQIKPNGQRQFFSDVLNPPKYLMELSEDLQQQQLINFKPDIIVVNGYIPELGNPCIGAHFDNGFDSDTASYSLGVHSRLAIKWTGKGIYGTGGGSFAIPLFKGSLKNMKKNSSIVTKIKHQILSKDISGNRYVVIFRKT